MSQQDNFDRILDSLHEAALDDSHWTRTSTLIDEACGSVGNNLIIYHCDSDSVSEFEWLFSRNYYHGELNQEIDRIYRKDYLHQDERLPILLRMPNRHLVHVPDFYTDLQLKTSATYNEFLVQARSQNGLNIRLDGGLDESRIIFVFSDPVEPIGWSLDQIKLIRGLLPHIRQYVCVRQTLVSAQARGLSLTSLLGNQLVGVILLDRQGVIVEANAHARDILQRGDGLYDQKGFLRARSEAHDTQLGQLLGRALKRSGGTMMIARSSPTRLRLALHLTPLPSVEADFGVRVPAVLVLVFDPVNRPSLPHGLGHATLGLTPAESQVASMLAEGRRVREIAVLTRRKESSVRWLFKQIYAKLGISRQADLVRLIISASGLAGLGEPEPAMRRRASSPPDRGRTGPNRTEDGPSPPALEE